MMVLSVIKDRSFCSCIPSVLGCIKNLCTFASFLSAKRLGLGSGG